MLFVHDKDSVSGSKETEAEVYFGQCPLIILVIIAGFSSGSHLKEQPGGEGFAKVTDAARYKLTRDLGWCVLESRRARIRK